MSQSDEVKASHILFKHQGSRRKVSWKDPKGCAISATSKERAIALLKNHLVNIKDGKETFEDVASRLSDCSSAKRSGNLGSFCRGKMEKQFEEATFNLKVGEISGVIETPSGVHIIKRTG